MPPRERTLQEKEEERKKILECALGLINSEGYDSLSMRKIAKELKFSATKIYNYFHNKDEIYIAITVESFKLFTTIIGSNLSKASTSGEKLECMIETFFSFSQDYKNNYEILFEQKAPRYLDYVGTPLENVAKEKKEVGFNWFNLFKSVLKEYIDDNSMDTKYDMDTIALNLFCIINGTINAHHNKIIHEIFDKPEEFIKLSSKRFIRDFENMCL